MNVFAWWTDRRVTKEGGGGPLDPERATSPGTMRFFGPTWRTRRWWHPRGWRR